MDREGIMLSDISLIEGQKLYLSVIMEYKTNKQKRNKMETLSDMDKR